MLNTIKVPGTVHPLRLTPDESAEVDSKLSHKYKSIVQNYFMELAREVPGEKKAEKSLRMRKVLSEGIRVFLLEHADSVDDKIKMKEAIKFRMILERIFTKDSIFIPKREEDSNIDFTLVENVFSDLEIILNHAWEAMHGGLYAKDMQDLANRINYLDSHWHGESGRQKLLQLGLDAEKIQRDRKEHPITMGLGEQVALFPAPFVLNKNLSLAQSLKEANLIIGQAQLEFQRLSPLVQRKAQFCFPSLKYDQIARGSASSNFHIFSSGGKETKIIGNNKLEALSRAPISALSMTTKPETKFDKNGKPVTSGSKEITFSGAVQEVKNYRKTLNDDPNVTNEDISNVDKYIAILDTMLQKYADSQEVNFLEFSEEFNQLYMKAYFTFEMPTVYIDEKKPGRLAIFFNYVNDMNQFVDSMYESGQFSSRTQPCVRIALLKPDNKYTKFARYYWDKDRVDEKTNKTGMFVICDEDLKWNPEIATYYDFTTLGSPNKYQAISLEEIQTNQNLLSIPLKDIEYAVLFASILAEIVPIDDGVYYYFKNPTQIAADFASGKPTVFALRPTDPAIFDYDLLSKVPNE